MGCNVGYNHPEPMRNCGTACDEERPCAQDGLGNTTADADGVGIKNMAKRLAAPKE